MRKTICFALAGVAMLGVTDIAAARTPIKLTNGQLDEVAAGASSMIAGSCSAGRGCSTTSGSGFANFILTGNDEGILLLANVALLAHVGALEPISTGLLGFVP